MGVRGNFWDLLKPYAKNEGPDYLRDRRVAVDLSFWLVQHDAAVRLRSPRARSPHIRVTFFRTIALFAKMGVYPVFVVDGDPSPLKSQARAERFFRASGLDPAEALARSVDKDDGAAATPGKQRNKGFTNCVQECVELLELLGIPVLRAKGEAEALCAQLNSEGYVDACITADSDAFLFGAKCVIKCLRSNSKEPFECYNFSDLEAGLSLKRKQMVAIALLVGNDHNLHGVPGFGTDTALRFVRLFNEDEILNRLYDVGKGIFPFAQCGLDSALGFNVVALDEGMSKSRSPHCSHCGHPGSKKAHSKSACNHCITNGYENCMEKPPGFRCLCSCCEKDRRSKETRKHENWQIKVCKMIAAEQNFPNDEIIQMYLCNNHGDYNENSGPSLRWETPKVEGLIDFLHYHQRWEPSYIRQRILPMLSTIYLREMTSKPPTSLLLCDQYEFHSVQRVKVRYGHPHYLVKWRKAAPCTSSIEYHLLCEESHIEKRESLEESESSDVLESDLPSVLIDDGCLFILTDENMELLKAAFPDEVEMFLEDKKLKESQSRQKKPSLKDGNKNIGSSMDTPNSIGVQLSIKEFYRSAKVQVHAKAAEGLTKKKESDMLGRRKGAADLEHNMPKSVRRRLLFN